MICIPTVNARVAKVKTETRNDKQYVVIPKSEVSDNEVVFGVAEIYSAIGRTEGYVAFTDTFTEEDEVYCFVSLYGTSSAPTGNVKYFIVEKAK